MSSFAPIFGSSAKRTLMVGGGTIVYEVAGSTPGATTAVLVPGIGDSRHEYRFLAPKLKDAGLNIILVEMRGTGESDAKFSSYTPEDVGRDVIAILDAEKVTSKVLFVGNSMAGATALFL
ncbi:hypothetical protein HDU93_002839, partial [Gonapodya sp. JEL0774]